MLRYVDFRVWVRPRSNRGPGPKMLWEWDVYGVLPGGTEDLLESGYSEGSEGQANTAANEAKTTIYSKFR